VPGASSGRRSVAMMGVVCGAIALHYRPRRKRRTHPLKVLGREEGARTWHWLGRGSGRTGSWLFHYIYSARSLSCFGWGVFFVAFLRFFFSSLYFYTFCLFLIRRGLDWIGWSGRFFFQSVIQCMMFFCAYDTLLTVPCRTVRVEVIPSFLPFFPFPFLCFHVAHRGITGDAVQCMILAWDRTKSVHLHICLSWASPNLFIMAKLTSGVLFFSLLSPFAMPCHAVLLRSVLDTFLTYPLPLFLHNTFMLVVG